MDESGEYNKSRCKVMIEQNFKSKPTDPEQVILGTTFLFSFNAAYKTSTGQVGLQANASGKGYFEIFDPPTPVPPKHEVPLWALITLVSIVGIAVATCIGVYVLQCLRKKGEGARVVEETRKIQMIKSDKATKQILNCNDSNCDDEQE